VRRIVPSAVVVVAAYLGLHRLGRAAGSTAYERGATLPGDEVVPFPRITTDHAVDVDAPASAIWPWLTQMGWHRGGWYTPRWVDVLLFPGNRPSADRLDPDLVRDLVVGDTVPDGPPGTAFFEVVRVEPPHVLVLRSTTHVPPGWDERFGVRLLWTWCFHLTDRPGGGTRLHLRVRFTGQPWWFVAAYRLLVPADFVMARGMLHGLRRRVDAGGKRPSPSG
jgi:hypothetical protein